MLGKVTGQRFDSYLLDGDYVVLNTIRLGGRCGCKEVIGKTLIPRSTIMYMKNDQHLSLSGCALAVVLLVVYCVSFNDGLEGKIVADSAMSLFVSTVLYVLYTKFSAGLTIGTTSGTYVSSNNIGDPFELENWFTKRVESSELA